MMKYGVDAYLRERPRRHLFHLDEEPLPATEHVVALLDLPQDGRHQQQQQEAPEEEGFTVDWVQGRTK